MARSRNIKPSIFLNEILGQEDPYLTLLFAGLWCLADREGILEDRPLRIKAEVFPYRESLDINGYLTVLSRLGFIHRYEINGVRYLYVVNFLKHQSPHHTEKASVFPKPVNVANTQGCDLTVNPPLENGEYPPDSLIPDSLIPDSKTPPTPQGGSVTNSDVDTNRESTTNSKPKRKRRTQEEIRFGYGENVRKVVNSVLSNGFWRKADPDGRPIVPDTSILCANVEAILDKHHEVTPELLIEAARNYMAKDKQAYSAPQYFFGSGKLGGDSPKWLAEVKFVMHQAQRKAEQEQARLEAEAMGATA